MWSAGNDIVCFFFFGCCFILALSWLFRWAFSIESETCRAGSGSDWLLSNSTSQNVVVFDKV